MAGINNEFRTETQHESGITSTSSAEERLSDERPENVSLLQHRILLPVRETLSLAARAKVRSSTENYKQDQNRPYSSKENIRTDQYTELYTMNIYEAGK